MKSFNRSKRKGQVTSAEDLIRTVLPKDALAVSIITSLPLATLRLPLLRLQSRLHSFSEKPVIEHSQTSLPEVHYRKEAFFKTSKAQNSRSRFICHERLPEKERIFSKVLSLSYYYYFTSFPTSLLTFLTELNGASGKSSVSATSYSGSLSAAGCLGSFP
ncbi:GDSL-like Lipase/Acylhydrolase superfamily protein [Striga asiatica]|uniref:GDSL-like Lipase/Acylhydrolase superfamily protein n=1 Tax=Striga asiatica TaxID=4170 RepID=A0A5A7Q1T9_STRAF|nr:GDSL-like Lipase/Acylhydrolase superfamily protein [Striga asiatica]